MLNDYDKHIAEELHAMDPPFYALIAAAVMKADSSNLRLLSRAYPDICTAVLGDTWYSIVYEVLRPVIVGCACAPEQGLMCLHHYERAESPSTVGGIEILTFKPGESPNDQDDEEYESGDGDDPARWLGGV